MTSRETPSISTGLHTNRSWLHWRKSTSLLSYLRSKLDLIYTVLVGLSMSICTALVSSPMLKTLGVGGIPGLSGVTGKQRLRSLSSAIVIAVAASLMVLCSLSSACRALASIVMTLVVPGILCLRYA
jgi:hypothetical protein